MSTQIMPARALPVETRLRMQTLLDEADAHFFQLHPDQPRRVRMHFRGERIDDHGEPTRYIVVTRQPDGTLERRFTDERGDA